MKFPKLVLTAALALTAVASQAAPNLISNGDFENFTGGSFSGYQTIFAGSPALPNWTIGGTSVDVINGGYGAISGNSIDMLGTPGPGTLSQSFVSIAGQSYVLSFDLSRNSDEYPYIGVSFNGDAQTQYLGGTGAAPNHYLVSYLANASSTILSFNSSPVAANSGVVLDNVSVTAVPEPETYAMLLSGLGLIGAIARRRKNKKV